MQNYNINIIYKDVKNVNLKVKPDGEVILIAPFDMSSKEIEYIIDKRDCWIRNQLELFSKNREPKRELVSGENFIYLGKNYRLKVIEADYEKAQLKRKYFELYLKDKNSYSKKERLINDWYKSKAEVYFKEIVDRYSKIVKVKVNSVKIRCMKTRWGSCNPQKSYINLNLELIKKPKVAIEYVIFHELTHLLHYHHNRDFYNYLTLHMPDWQKRKAKLETI